MAGSDGTRRNEPYEGFDAYFGFHLYHALADPENKSLDSALTPLWRAPAQPMQTDASLTNEGNMKRIYQKKSRPPWPCEEAAEGEPEEELAEEPEEGDEEDDWNLVEQPLGVESMTFDWDEQWEEDNRAAWMESLAACFDGREEYIEACERFAALYRRAPPEVLRGFYEELEEIVNLYLLRRGLAPLADTDQTLDVNRRVYDGPCRQAQRYARGTQWESL